MSTLPLHELAAILRAQILAIDTHAFALKGIAPKEDEPIREDLQADYLKMLRRREGLLREAIDRLRTTLEEST